MNNRLRQEFTGIRIARGRWRMFWLLRGSVTETRARRMGQYLRNTFCRIESAEPSDEP